MVPHLSSVSATYWLVVLLQAVCFLWIWWGFFVSACDFICSLILDGVTFFWERPWFCISGRIQLGQTYLGAVVMSGPGGTLRQPEIRKSGLIIS